MYKSMSLCAGKEYQLSANLIVKAFPTIHPVQSQVMPQSLLSDPQTCNFGDAYSNFSSSLQGYVVYSQKRKLRAELAGLSQKEIRDRRIAGEVCRQLVGTCHRPSCHLSCLQSTVTDHHSAAPSRWCLVMGPQCTTKLDGALPCATQLSSAGRHISCCDARGSLHWRHGCRSLLVAGV